MGMLIELLDKLLEKLLGWSLQKWRSHRERSSKFEELKRNVFYLRIVNNLPVELHKLRVFFIQNGLVEKQGFNEFFYNWLSQTFVEEGQAVLVPGHFSNERIAELHQELAALKL